MGGRDPVGQPQKRVTPQFVFYVLRRWWMTATPVGLLLAGIAAAVVFVRFEKVYEASTLLRISSQEPYVAYAPSQSGRGGDARFVQTQFELIRHRLVLEPVISQSEATDVPELQVDDPIQWLAEHIEVKSSGKSELFKISITCADPKDSAWLVNAVVDQYFLLLGQHEAERSREIILMLKEEREIRKALVERKREDLRELSRQVMGEDPFAPVAMINPDLGSPIAELNSRLITIQVEQAVLKARIQVHENELAEQQAQAPAGLLDEAVEQDPRVRRLQGRIALNETKLQDRESTLRPNRIEDDPGCQGLRNALSEDEKLLKECRAEVRERIKQRLESSQIAQLESQLFAMKSELDGYQITEKLLRESLDEKRDESKGFSGETLELYFLRSELTEAEGVLAVLSDRILRLTTEQRAPDRVKRLQEAKEAAAPVVEVPWKTMALASLVFFVPFGLAGVWEYFVRRVSNSRQLEESADLRVIGEIAQLPVQTRTSRGGSKARVDRAVTIFEESIDGLRTHLMLSEELVGMKVLAVTSAAEDEGKTSVAAQLAVNIALVSGKPTLLIDGDMRSPDIHNIFDIPREPGLAEILAGKCGVEDAIVGRKKHYTDVLPAGKLRTNPHRLLGNGTLRSLLEEVRSKYDYIIIDTPPILAASETLVLAKMADKTLMCAMKDSSRIDQIKKAHERLAVAGTHPIGVVLNGVPAGQYHYRYGVYAYSRD